MALFDTTYSIYERKYHIFIIKIEKLMLFHSLFSTGCVFLYKGKYNFQKQKFLYNFLQAIFYRKNADISNSQ